MKKLLTFLLNIDNGKIDASLRLILKQIHP